MQIEWVLMAYNIDESKRMEFLRYRNELNAVIKLVQRKFQADKIATNPEDCEKYHNGFSFPNISENTPNPIILQ